MPRTVGDVGDELLALAFGVAQQPIDGADDDFNQVDVLPFVESADIVGFGDAAFVEDQVDGAGVVFDVEPVADILALAIDRQRPAVADVVDEQRDQLFGKLIGPVVVRAVGYDRRQTVGVVVGPHEMVGRGFGRRIGGVGIVAGFLCEERAVELQRTIYFVGRNMIEAFPLPVAVPLFLGCLQQGKRAHDIGAGEDERILDRTIDVAFGGQVDHSVDIVLAEHFADGVVVADVGLDEGVVRSIFDVSQVGQIAGIGQFIEIDDPIVGIFVYEEPHHMRADESGAAGNEDVAFHVFAFSVFISRCSG